MYKQSIIYNLVKVAKKDNGFFKFINNMFKKPRNIEQYNFDNISLDTPKDIKPIEMDPNINATAVNIRDVLEQGSGKDLKMPVSPVNDIYSSYMYSLDPENKYRQLFVNPNNPFIQSHEYGHAIDVADRGYMRYLNHIGAAIHPAIGNSIKLNLERAANKKSDIAFLKAVKDEGLKRDYMDLKYRVADPFYKTYTSSLNPGTIGSLIGSAIGGGVGYWSSGDDITSKVLNTGGGVYIGGYVGNTLGNMYGAKNTRKYLKEGVNILRSKEYTDKVNDFNKRLNDYMIEQRANKPAIAVVK